MRRTPPIALRVQDAVRALARAALPASACAALLGGGAARAQGPGDPFLERRIESPGRVAAAELVDLDGDGRSDLFAVAFSGIPPDDRRELRVHFQREDGALPDAPDLVLPLPEGAAAYDTADLADGPGRELVFLRHADVRVLACPGRAPRSREIALPSPTAGVVRDERGIDRLEMARPELPGRLLVPGLAELFVVDAAGGAAATLAVGARSNYCIPPRPGPGLGENELESFYDFPRIDAGDVDGDGRCDLVTSNRFEIRSFLQRADGSFGAKPDRALATARLSEEDLIRGSGLVRTRAEDFDGDGRADLIVTYTAGGFLNARARTTLHRNRGGSWDLAQADQELGCEGCYLLYDLLDLEGDGKVELMEARIPLGVLSMVETLLTRSVDADAKIFPRGAEAPFASEPVFTTRTSVGIRFETFEPKGFFPTLRHDWNGDGWLDRIDSGGGEAIEIYLGGPNGALRERAARQDFDTAGSLRTGDLDGDGLLDALLFDRTRPGAPIRIGVNQGVLPGTRPRISAP